MKTVDLNECRKDPARRALMVCDKVHEMIQTIQMNRGLTKTSNREIVETALVAYYAAELKG